MTIGFDERPLLAETSPSNAKMLNDCYRPKAGIAQWSLHIVRREYLLIYEGFVPA